MLSKKRNYSVSFSTEIYPSEAAKDVQGRLQMVSGRSALDKIAVGLHHKLGQEGEAKHLSLCGSGGSHKRTVLATLT